MGFRDFLDFGDNSLTEMSNISAAPSFKTKEYHSEEIFTYPALSLEQGVDFQVSDSWDH